MDSMKFKENSRDKSNKSESNTSKSDSNWRIPKCKKRKLSLIDFEVSDIEKCDKICSSELEEVLTSENNSEKSELSDSGLESADGLIENRISRNDNKVRLGSLTEGGNNLEFFNIFQKRQCLNAGFEIEKFKQGIEQQKKNNYAVISADRQKKLKENKNDKFLTLKAEREDKRLKDLEKEKRKLKTSEVFSSSEGSDSDTSPQSESVKKRKRFSSFSSSSTSKAFNSERDSRRFQSSFSNNDHEILISSKEELEKIRLSRFKMEKYVHSPIFSKAVVGCFVRIGIGNNQDKPVYKVAEILQVVETAKIYNLGDTRTNKGLKLRHGNEERVIRLEFFSNSCFSDSEFQKWMESCSCDNIALPSIAHIKKKQKDINDLLNYQYSNDDVEKMIRERARFNSRPINFTRTKILLHEKRDVALHKGDEIAVEQIKNEINELEEKALALDKKKTASIASISYINKRNREKNVEGAEKVILAEIKEEKDMQIEDPCIRRKTRPSLMQKNSLKVHEVMTSDLLRRLEEERKQKLEIERKQKLEIECKQKEELHCKYQDETKEKDEESKRDLSHDPFLVHNFDIKIDLDSPAAPSAILQPKSISAPKANDFSFSLARKPSLLEDYKKKRGFI